MIYLISDGNNCKIGWAINPDKRLKQLQTAHPKPLKLIQVWEAPKFKEKLAHKMLSSFRSRLKGEWFALPPTQLLDILDTIIKLPSPKSK